MGRYDFRPQRVFQTASQLLAVEHSARRATPPPWFDIVAKTPPSQVLIRPLQRTQPARRGRKPSRLFQPMPIVYPEDKLRAEFFGDHPWELARPKVVLEGDGNDAMHWDWSRIQQPGKRLDGESVVQRQFWLMQYQGLGKNEAYDKARKEFYKYRHLEDIERRVANEEAQATGAYFGPGPLEYGMKLEDRKWEAWKKWATKEIEQRKQLESAVYSGSETDEDSVDAPADPEALGEEPEEPIAAV
ncbi:37S ribosomal protein Rsm25 [Trichodelitschia bisporula]|uniref:Small ribosomal subunit protein mS23 n=1 Tax=Trichodelitschia bisporula TaxID=703511 RepID=A0A6G1HTE7_9PEZI|nr:37S ribosomal protein Rsm25 [Trichodelitschia bisporula]